MKETKVASPKATETKARSKGEKNILTVEEIFTEFLKKKGYRSTPERAMVLNEIYASAGTSTPTKFSSE